MSAEDYPNSTLNYELMIEGHLSQSRAHLFEGMRVILLPNGETLIAGPLKDQAALFGILIRIRDLGLILLSISSSDSME